MKNKKGYRLKELEMFSENGEIIPYPYFCDFCRFLNPKEDEQKKNEQHFCSKYEKVVRHEGYHPRLLALEECELAKIRTERFKILDKIIESKKELTYLDNKETNFFL